MDFDGKLSRNVFGVEILQWQMEYQLACPPAQDASHHQDYYIFIGGSRTKPSGVPLLLGGVTTENISES